MLVSVSGLVLTSGEAMDITFKSNTDHISSELESYAVMKLQRLSKYLDKIKSISVNLIAGNSRRKESSFKVELHLVSPGHELHSAAESNSFRAAIDTGFESLKSQLSKLVDKRTTKQRSDAGVAKAARQSAARQRNATPWDESETHFKVEKYLLKPLSVQEAIAELKLSKSDLQIFVNQSGQVNAVLRRGTRFTLYEPESGR
jgi:putative sigma-54 modulation protein